VSGRQQAFLYQGIKDLEPMVLPGAMDRWRSTEWLLFPRGKIEKEQGQLSHSSFSFVVVFRHVIASQRMLSHFREVST